MNGIDMERVLPKLADVEHAIYCYYNFGEAEQLQNCINDSSYDDIWGLRFDVKKDVKSKFDIWNIIRYEKEAQESRLFPYAQCDFNCCKMLPPPPSARIAMIYAYKGSVECSLPDKYFVLKENQLCIVNPDALLNCSSSKSSYFFLNISFTKMYLNNTLLHRFPSSSPFMPFFEQVLFDSVPGMDYLVFDLRDSPRAASYYLAAAESFMQNEPSMEEMQSSLIYLVFCELTRIWQARREQAERPNIGITAYDIINYISANYKTVTLASISEHFHFHPDYMGKTIKNLLNKNFIDVVQDIRLTAACQMLRGTNMSISQIIAESGYKNNSHFYTLFKKRYECSPAEYRHNKKQISI